MFSKETELTSGASKPASYEGGNVSGVKQNWPRRSTCKGEHFQRIEPKMEQNMELVAGVYPQQEASRPGAYVVPGTHSRLSEDDDFDDDTDEEAQNSDFQDASVSRREDLISAQLVDDAARAQIVDLAAIRRRRRRGFVLVVVATAVVAAAVASAVAVTQVNTPSSSLQPPSSQSNETVPDPRPLNDLCKGAIVIDKFDGEPINGTTAFATANESISVCGSANEVMAPDVWYVVVGTGAALEAKVCSDYSDDFDSQITVLSGSCGNFMCITSNKNAGRVCDSSAGARWISSRDTLYFVVIHGGNESESGDFRLRILSENNHCETATGPLKVGAVEAGSTVTNSTFDEIAVCGRARASNSSNAWYTVVGTGRVLVAPTCTDPFDLDGQFDTQITILSGDCGNLTCVEGNNDERDGRCAGVNWNSSATTLYYIVVHGYQGQTGSFELAIRSLNDKCEDAVGPLSVGDIVLGSTVLATSDGIAECGDAEFSENPGVWYTVQGRGARLTATTCTNIFDLDGDFDSQITVLAGGCDSLTCVDGNDDSEANPCGSESTVSWDTVNEEVYHILVHGYYDEYDTFAFTIQEFINDRCGNAVGPLAVGDTEHGSTVTAAKSVVSPCGTASASNAPGLWYSVIGDGNVLTAMTCTKGFYAQITVLSDNSCNNYECVTGDAFPKWAGCGKVRWATSAGTMYYIFVHGIREQTGSFDLTVLPSVNDQCEVAIGPLQVGDVVVGSTIGASGTGMSRIDRDCDVSVSYIPSVWYSVEGTGNELMVTTCPGAGPEDGFKSQILVLSGTCDAGLGCVQVGVGDHVSDLCKTDAESSVSWNSTSGEIYYLLVYGSLRSETGSFRLVISTASTAP